MIPADETVPLAGSKFVEWEDLGDEVDRTLVPVFLEERAALEASAQADCGGRCPHCQSDRVYLIEKVGQVEVMTPHGPVVLKKQRCRCRACDRSFSPTVPELAEWDCRSRRIFHPRRRRGWLVRRRRSRLTMPRGR